MGVDKGGIGADVPSLACFHADFADDCEFARGDFFASDGCLAWLGGEDGKVVTSMSYADGVKSIREASSYAF